MERKRQLPPTPTGDPSRYRGAKRKRYEALAEMRGQLSRQVRSLSSTSLKSTRQAGEDLADVGSDSFSRQLGLTLMSEEEQRLLLIEDALDRLTNGTYGTCQECMQAIPAPRLDAIPYARLCVECKSQQESSEGRGPARRPRTPSL